MITTEQIEQLKMAYEPRVLRTMQAWAEALAEYGYAVSSVDDMADECYSWGLAAYPNGEKRDFTEPDDCIDIRFTIAESGSPMGAKSSAGSLPTTTLRAFGLTILMSSRHDFAHSRRSLLTN